MTTIKEKPPRKDQTVNILIPGKIVLTKEDAKKHNINGGVCVIKHRHSLKIYLNPLKTSINSHDRIIQRIKQNAVIKINEDYLEHLPSPITESDLLKEFESSQTIGIEQESYFFHVFNFNEHTFVIPEIHNSTKNTTMYTEPILITRTEQRTTLPQL